MAEALQVPKKPQWGGLGMFLCEQKESHKTGKAKYKALPDAAKAVYKEQYAVAMGPRVRYKSDKMSRLFVIGRLLKLR